MNLRSKTTIGCKAALGYNGRLLTEAGRCEPAVDFSLSSFNDSKFRRRFYMKVAVLALMVLCIAGLCGPPMLNAGENDNLILQNASPALVNLVAVQKTPAPTPAWLRGVPDPPSTGGLLAAVVIAKEKIKPQTRGIRVQLRRGVRINCPLGTCRAG
jgi:hypothetical protein